MSPNLRGISDDVALYPPEIKAFFPKLSLKELSLVFARTTTDLKKVVDIIAESGSTTLESIHFDMKLNPPDTFMLQ